MCAVLPYSISSITPFTKMTVINVKKEKLLMQFIGSDLFFQ